MCGYLALLPTSVCWLKESTLDEGNNAVRRERHWKNNGQRVKCNAQEVPWVVQIYVLLDFMQKNEGRRKCFNHTIRVLQKYAALLGG